MKTKMIKMLRHYMNRWLFLSALFLGAYANASNFDMPATAEEAFKRTEVVHNTDGSTRFVGPPALFDGRTVMAFVADVKPKETIYGLAAVISGRANRVRFTRAEMERNRAKGFVFIAKGVSLQFPPPYFEGFLRRVDALEKTHSAR